MKLQQPIKIDILATVDTSPSTLFGLYDVLSSVGVAWENFVNGKPGTPVFDVRIVAASREPFACANEVLVKPHTRTGKDAGIYRELPLSNVAEISSVELCEWADVMLVIGSSIIIETLKQGKPTLYLKYLHENTTEYEEFGACWIIHDEGELQDALRSLRDSKSKVPYRGEDVDRWLSEIIYGGRSERDVLKDYAEFIVSCADQYDAPDVQ